MADFVHLHVHTQYSLLDGLSALPDLVSRAKAHGQTALAITDHGAMYGAVHFYNQCKAQGIKPIIGVEAYMSETSRHDKQVRMGADQFHLTLLAKTNKGYRNLLSLVSLAHLEGFSYKPRIDWELLEKYHEDLIVTSGCASSLINKKLLQKKPREAREWIERFYGLFENDFYIEIQHHPKLKDLEELTHQQVALAREFGLPLLATNDVHYVDPDDAEAQDALLAVQTRKTIADTNRMSMLSSPDFYLKSSEEMAEAFAEYPEALENSLKVAEVCNVEIPTGKMIFPNYPIETGETLSSTLKKMTYEGAKTRFTTVDAAIVERIEYELEIISQKGYDSYFLIVQDFVNWAKEHNIGVGPGRGSAAGSLVSYCLRITEINPLEHELAFERFLNPQRPSPPDIDIDIADIHRDDVIRYVAQKYGEDHVAQVITFGTMEARAAIRDIGRVLGMPYSEPDTIAKLIPVKVKLKDAVVQVPELQAYYVQPKYKKLLDLSMKVEGAARHHSVHAAAVIIADKPLVQYTPIQRETKGGKTVTQYDMYALDLNVDEGAIGLLKMDFLGLRNLSILDEAVENVVRQGGERVDLNRLPLDDEGVFKLIAEGETTGIFQMESAGMRRVARTLKPSVFSDITAMLALYRPGPMELIDEFVRGKHEIESVVYPHDDLKPVLQETYGIPVYQEQVLQIANVFAGYSLGEADILRRAIGKKKKYILDKEKKRFIKGAGEKGYSASKAEEIWGFIEKFAGYGFNKAHSAAYAMIAYQTAYMKVHYPLEYMCALLSIESQSHSNNRDEKIAQAIEECNRMGITVLPPHINHSTAGFGIETLENNKGKAIRFGFRAIKNVGEAAIESILEQREVEGEFGSLTSFFARVDNQKVNKRVVESLIKSGCFDSFGNRAALLAAYDSLREQGLKQQKQKESGQVGLFDKQKSSVKVVKDKLPNVPELPTIERLEAEKKLLGVYISGHPLKQSLAGLEQYQTTPINKLEVAVGGKIDVRVGGMITSVRQVMTKKSNKEMAFARLEDMSGSIDMVIFPRTFQEHKQILKPNSVVFVKGELENRENEMSLLVTSLTRVSKEQTFEVQNNLQELPAHSIIIKRTTNQSQLSSLGQLLKASPGKDIVTIAIEDGSGYKSFKLPYPVAFTNELQHRIDELLPA